MVEQAQAGDRLISQAIMNSGITVETEETVIEGTSQEPEIMNIITVGSESEENISEIHDKDELDTVEMEVEVRVLSFCLVG